MTRTACCMLIIAIGLLAGCASPAYWSLRPQAEIPELAALLENRPDLVTTRTRTYGDSGRELEVAVHEEVPESDRVTIMIHGVLADSRGWRFVTGRLSEGADLMLVDLPGNGLSEAPPPFILKREDPDGYSTKALAYRAAEAIDARLAARPEPPESIAIVAHSLGTLVTLRMLADQTIAPFDRDWMDRVDRLVLISPIDPAMPYGPPSLEAVANASWLTVELGELTGMLRERLAVGMKRSYVDPSRLPREQVDQLNEIIEDNHRRSVAQDVLKSVFPTVVIDGVYYPDWTRTEQIIRRHRTLGNRDVASLLIIGERDEVAPGSMAYRLATQLANAQIVSMALTKHSPHIERSWLTGDIIRRFIDDARVKPRGTLHEHMVLEHRVEPGESPAQ